MKLFIPYWTNIIYNQNLTFGFASSSITMGNKTSTTHNNISKNDSKIFVSYDYVVKFSQFFGKLDIYQETMPDALEKLKGVYIPLFQIMDEAKARKVPCILKDIMHTTLSTTAFSDLLSLLSDADVNEFIVELQKDVDLILQSGFSAFEEKILNMFKDFEEDNKEFEKLLTKFDDLHQSMKDIMQEMTPSN